MNKYKLLLVALLMQLAIIGSAFANSARVQVIHNSADRAAAEVDIWLNNVLLLDNFKFRQATPFVDAPAGVPITISIQPSNSVDTVGALAKFTYTLEAGKKYIIIANGIVIPTGYNPVKPFNLYVYDMGRETASNPNNTDVLAFHGSTDAPTVDVVESLVGAGTIIDNFEYGKYAGYLELPNENFKLDIKDESGTTTVISYNAPLKDLNLKGKSLVLMASGFLNPAANNNGEAFGLFAVLSDGTVAALPPSTMSNVIENSFINKLFTNYPNPFSDETNITFNVESPGRVIVNIYDYRGKLITTLLDEVLPTGEQKIKFSSNSLPSGIYSYKIIKDSNVISGIMNVIK